MRFCTLYVYFEQTLAQKVHKIPSGGWKDIYRTGNFLGDHGCRSIFAYDALHKLIHSNAISTVVCIALGGVVYIVCLFLFKGLSEEELITSRREQR